MLGVDITPEVYFCEFFFSKCQDQCLKFILLDGHTIEKMRVVWKKGFDQSKVTDNNYISLTQFEYAVFFEENYEEEIASGNAQQNEFTLKLVIFISSKCVAIFASLTKRHLNS